VLPHVIGCNEKVLSEVLLQQVTVMILDMLDEQSFLTSQLHMSTVYTITTAIMSMTTTTVIVLTMMPAHNQYWPAYKLLLFITKLISE